MIIKRVETASEIEAMKAAILAAREAGLASNGIQPCAPYDKEDPKNYEPYTNPILDKYRVRLRKIEDSGYWTTAEREDSLFDYRAKLLKFLYQQDELITDGWKTPLKCSSAYAYEQTHTQEFVDLLIALNAHGGHFAYNAAIAEIVILLTAFENRLSLPLPSYGFDEHDDSTTEDEDIVARCRADRAARVALIAMHKEAGLDSIEK
jgi:hypothetical protein